MKKNYLLLLILLVFSSCSKDEGIIEKPSQALTNITLRSTNDAKNIVIEYLGSMNVKSNPIDADKMTVEVITSEDFPETKALSKNDIPFKSDTLFYFISGVDNPMIISANKACDPILAILDNPIGSLKNEMNNIVPNNVGLMMFLENAVAYNQYTEFNPTKSQERELRFLDQVYPKLMVEWDQTGPFARYTPYNWPAGCVAIAAAQAFTVTRHVASFNNVPLEWNSLIKVKNSSYESSFPLEMDIIARFIREIGNAVGMEYGSDGSGAKTADAIRLFTQFDMMYLTEDKARIREILKDYMDGIIIISSRTKPSIIGISRGEGHSYIVDGYKRFQDMSDLMHVNYGWGPGYNGYYLTCLYSPYFTDDAPSKYPHDWTFYCIYKQKNPIFQ
ncbi:MAG: C10 family peptidase [Bacteroidales bacterium]